MDLIINLRADVPSVRDQKDRATCLAFALSAAHASHQSLSGWFSVEYLFYHAIQLMPEQNPSLGLSIAAAGNALYDNGQPVEAVWPYQPIDLVPLPRPPANLNPIWRAEAYWSHHQNVETVFTELEQRRLLVLGLQLSPDFYQSPTNPYLIKNTGPGFGSHAVLAVGLGKSAMGEIWTLIQNSWGTEWGDSGYAWTSPGYLKTHLTGHMVIQ